MKKVDCVNPDSLFENVEIRFIFLKKCVCFCDFKFSAILKWQAVYNGRESGKLTTGKKKIHVLFSFVNYDWFYY